MPVAGDLYLTVNDGFLSDNSGRFTVAITLLGKGN